MIAWASFTQLLKTKVYGHLAVNFFLDSRFEKWVLAQKWPPRVSWTLVLKKPGRAHSLTNVVRSHQKLRIVDVWPSTTTLGKEILGPVARFVPHSAYWHEKCIFCSALMHGLGTMCIRTLYSLSWRDRANPSKVYTFMSREMHHQGKPMLVRTFSSVWPS